MGWSKEWKKKYLLGKKKSQHSGSIATAAAVETPLGPSFLIEN